MEEKTKLRFYLSVTAKGTEPFTDGIESKIMFTLDNPNNHSSETILKALQASTEAILQIK